jgi:HTH-type transcriptional regulator / antitoxin HigA
LKVKAMEITPIKTQRDYRRILKEIEGLMTAKRNTPRGDRLDVLVALVETWERKHYPFDLPDPVEAIKYHMDQNGLQPRDLIPFIGSRNRVHEVLNRRRPFTLKMIWRLHEGLGIPAESLSKHGRLTRRNEIKRRPLLCRVSRRHSNISTASVNGFTIGRTIAKNSWLVAFQFFMTSTYGAPHRRLGWQICVARARAVYSGLWPATV